MGVVLSVLSRLKGKFPLLRCVRSVKQYAAFLENNELFIAEAFCILRV